jgi:hypothetical protein
MFNGKGYWKVIVLGSCKCQVTSQHVFVDFRYFGWQIKIVKSKRKQDAVAMTAAQPLKPAAHESNLLS